MPRSPRLHVPGACYHVILRGNHREPLRLETVHSLQARQQASINPHTNNPSPVPVQPIALPLDFLTFSWDGARNRLLIEYTRMGGTLLMGVSRAKR